MASNYNIVLLPGDGIGPEITRAGLRVLGAVGERFGFAVFTEEHLAGGAAIDAHNDPMPDPVLEACKAADAVFLGAVGGPQWDHHTGTMRPESGLLKLRKELGVFANLRPVSVPASLAAHSPLREDAVRDMDLLVVRELTGGIYFGLPSDRSGPVGEETAFNTMRYTTGEIRRIARIAFERAAQRSGRLTSVDKANVLVVSQLWRDVVTQVHQDEFPDVELSHMYLDNAAMQLVLNPRQFDVIVTGNLFGDVLSDAAATLGGSLGLLPSASLGGGTAVFEPVHGSAPDIAGQDKANPIAAILSMAMMLDHLGEGEAAAAMRNAVTSALDAGLRTGDLWHEGLTRVGTDGMTARIVASLATAV